MTMLMTLSWRLFLIFYGIDTNHKNSVGKNFILRSNQNKEQEKFIL